MNVSQPTTLTEEEKLVAELALLGVGYLSRQTAYQASSTRPPDVLLADLVRQPSARVRTAVIAVLLAHPQYASAIPAAMERLQPQQQLTLESFYLAAALLQKEHAHHLRSFLATRWQWLPNLQKTSMKLKQLAQEPPRTGLAALGREYQRQTRTVVNWVGTYEHVVQQLLRHWEMERRWSR